MIDREPDHPPPSLDASCRLRIRLVFDDGAMLGPGKADLLELIRETGSIAAAARRMGMSYKRAWLLVETLNATFRETLVESARGGRGHGGARLTETGEKVLGTYRAMERRAGDAATAEIAALRALRPGDAASGKRRRSR
jgi:molybdate transport system regulatory protein